MIVCSKTGQALDISLDVPYLGWTTTGQPARSVFVVCMVWPRLYAG